MREPVTGVGKFVRSFRECMSNTWKETDRQYHIPKSRFRGGPSRAPAEGGASARKPGKRYLKRFRNCFSTAWKASDRHYHIPKSKHGKVF